MARIGAAGRVALCALMIWAPLPLGSNRAIFWSVNAFFASLVVAFFLIEEARRGYTEKLDWPTTAWLLTGLAVVAAWMLIQALPLSTPILEHPLRSRLAEGLSPPSGAITANPSATLSTVAQFAPPVFVAAVAAILGTNGRHAALLLKVI
ncbi:MAG: hypothetical protein ACRED5_18995, partial [Propylenella sp.]